MPMYDARVARLNRELGPQFKLVHIPATFSEWFAATLSP